MGIIQKLKPGKDQHQVSGEGNAFVPHDGSLVDVMHNAMLPGRSVRICDYGIQQHGQKCRIVAQSHTWKLTIFLADVFADSTVIAAV